MHSSPEHRVNLSPQWLPKDQYMQQRDQYVNKNFLSKRQEIEMTLLNIHKLEISSEEIDVVTRVYLRSFFAGQQMVQTFEHLKQGKKGTLTSNELDESILVHPVFAADPARSAMLLPIFKVNGVEKNSEDLTPDEMQQYMITSAHLGINLNSIVHSYNEMAKMSKTSNNRQHYLSRVEEELAIMFEVATVEEAAHAYHFFRTSQQPQRKQRLLQQYINYIPPQSELHQPAYENQYIERQAHLWCRSFLKMYYPDSVAMKVEQEMLQEQLKAKEK